MDEIRLITKADGLLIITSLEIADLFEKLHKDVLRTIENLENSPDYPDFTERNFAPSSYVDPSGRTLPAVDCTEAGALRLAMKFSGPKAASCQVRLIEAFQAQRRKLRQIAAGHHRPQSVETVQQNHQQILQLLAENSRVLSEKVDVLGDRIDGHDRRLTDLERSTRRNPRKEITAETKREHLQCFWRRGGRCPCCEKSKKQNEIEFDHFHDCTRALFTETWPICKKCHTGLTTGKIDRVSVQTFFAAYQLFARQWLTAPPEQSDFVGFDA